jgi:predicted ATPase
MADPHEFVVLAGGPGAGKTTLLEALRARGFAVVPESVREIIRDQRAIGGPGATGPELAELALSWDIRAHRRARDYPGPVFFDRSAAEWVGYFPLLGLATPGHVRRAARLFRYHPTVFLLPPWREIYVNDTERGQDWAAALRGHTAARDTYQQLGYHIVELPRTDVPGRVAALLGHLGLAQS